MDNNTYNSLREVSITISATINFLNWPIKSVSSIVTSVMNLMNLNLTVEEGAKQKVRTKKVLKTVLTAGEGV